MATLFELTTALAALALSSAPALGQTPAPDSSSHRQIVLDGTVDASAAYLDGTAFVTTTFGKTIAIDPARGKVRWTYTPPQYDDWAGSYRITNSTPATDPSGRFIYAAAPDGRVRKLDAANGHEIWSTSVTKLPAREKIASPLTYYHGRIIAVTGGYIGDAPPYQGHVALLDAESGRLLAVWNSLCSDRTDLLDPSSCNESGSAIWGRAGAVVDSTTGSIFIATGNGQWDGRTNWGDAVVELDSTATKVLGNYTPTDTHRLDEADADLGSTSPVLLGDGLVAQGGKDGKIRLLDWSEMRGTTPHLGGEIQTVPTPSGGRLFTAPAVWRHDGATWLFAADRGGTAAWKLENRKLQPAWHNDTPGTSPVASGGRVYVYNPRGGLNIYSAATGQLITTLDSGAGHWNVPLVTDRFIILPEGNANRHEDRGVVDIWDVGRESRVVGRGS